MRPGCAGFQREMQPPVCADHYVQKRGAYLAKGGDAPRWRRATPRFLAGVGADIVCIYDRLFTADRSTCKRIHTASESKFLSRYPILVQSKEIRDYLIMRLRHLRLGATTMYGDTLPHVEGVPLEVLDNAPIKDFDSARSFADRLLTLPVHSGVRTIDAESICEIIRNST